MWFLVDEQRLIPGRPNCPINAIPKFVHPGIEPHCDEYCATRTSLDVELLQPCPTGWADYHLKGPTGYDTAVDVFEPFDTLDEEILDDVEHLDVAGCPCSCHFRRIQVIGFDPYPGVWIPFRITPKQFQGALPNGGRRKSSQSF